MRYLSEVPAVKGKVINLFGAPAPVVEPTLMDLVKLDVFSRLVQAGMTQVYFCPKGESVAVPTDYKIHDVMVLNFSHRFGTPLEYDEQGIRQTLSFRGVEHDVVVPWLAVRTMRLAAEENNQAVAFMGNAE